MNTDMYEKLPQELKERGSFCLWKYEERDGRMTKVPYQTSGLRADSMNKATFTDYSTAISLRDKYDGIGIGVFDDICTIDIDHCIENGVLSDMTEDIISRMDSYTEYSPSGIGVRILFKASLPSYGKERYYINNLNIGLEVYVAGYTSRFVTVTGNTAIGTAIEDRTEALAEILEKYMVRPGRPVSQSSAPGSYLSDDSVLSKISASKQAEKFNALWNGNIPDGKSHSEADAALCAMLAFWCGGDTDQMDRLFADVFKEIARFVPERKQWFIYDGTRWVPDTGALKAMELCKDLADALMRYALDIHVEHKRKSYIDYCRKWQSRHVRITILCDAQSMYPIPMQEFDRDKDLLNCANGTIDLNSMQFKEHDPEDRMTKIIPVEYIPGARSERFDRFISEIMSGDIQRARFLQKSIGYALGGDTRFECMFFLYGATTRNGKGTLMESILRVMGDYGKSVRAETLAQRHNINSQAPSEDLARLAGVRLANIAEPSRGMVLNAAQVKNITGNDTINARFLHENSFDFEPQFKIYVNTNYLPAITDTTMFTSERVLIIPFDKHFEA